MFYELKNKNGDVYHMRLIEGISVESELEKWTQEDREAIASWKQIDAWPEIPTPTPLAVDLTGLPDTIRDVLIGMGEVISTMQGQRDQDRAQIAALAQLRDHDQQRIAQLEQTNQVISQKLLRD